MKTVTISFVCVHATPGAPPETRVTQMADGEYGLLCKACTQGTPGTALDYVQLDQPFEHEVSDQFWQKAKSAIN